MNNTAQTPPLKKYLDGWNMTAHTIDYKHLTRSHLPFFFLYFFLFVPWPLFRDLSPSSVYSISLYLSSFRFLASFPSSYLDGVFIFPNVFSSVFFGDQSMSSLSHFSQNLVLILVHCSSSVFTQFWIRLRKFSLAYPLPPNPCDLKFSFFDPPPHTQACNSTV